MRIEKRGANTRWVAAELARQAQVSANDVGFAGLKDRHAVTVQWFSVPVRSTTADYWSAVHTADASVMASIKSGQLSCVSSGCHDNVHDVAHLSQQKFWQEAKWAPPSSAWRNTLKRP